MAKVSGLACSAVMCGIFFPSRRIEYAVRRNGIGQLAGGAERGSIIRRSNTPDWKNFAVNVFRFARLIVLNRHCFFFFADSRYVNGQFGVMKCNEVSGQQVEFKLGGHIGQTGHAMREYLGIDRYCGNK